jgi:phosphohistidine phosphatase
MNLYLMRHGVALSREDLGIESDAERTLSPKGMKRMRRVARGMARLGIPFSTLLTSPLIRARQTADIVAAALGLESELQEISGLAPESSVESLLFGLTRFQNREHILLVGHQPLLTDTASYLLSGKSGVSLALPLKKGGLCRIETDALPATSRGTLHWLLTPKQLRLMSSKQLKF